MSDLISRIMEFLIIPLLPKKNQKKYYESTHIIDGMFDKVDGFNDAFAQAVMFLFTFIILNILLLASYLLFDISYTFIKYNIMTIGVIIISIASLINYLFSWRKGLFKKYFKQFEHEKSDQKAIFLVIRSWIIISALAILLIYISW